MLQQTPRSFPGAVRDLRTLTSYVCCCSTSVHAGSKFDEGKHSILSARSSLGEGIKGIRGLSVGKKAKMPWRVVGRICLAWQRWAALPEVAHRSAIWGNLGHRPAGLAHYSGTGWLGSRHRPAGLAAPAGWARGTGRLGSRKTETGHRPAGLARF